jgi:signal transduction histidine kinase
MTAHEVLNPMNNISIRIDRFRKNLLDSRSADVEIFRQIVLGWRTAYRQGGAAGLLQELEREPTAGKKLVDEDLENLEGIASDYLELIRGAGEDMDFVLSQISRITKIVDGMRTLSLVGGERRLLDIHLPLDDTLLALRDSAEKHGIALVREFSQDSRTQFVVLADREELVQVFSNLMKNAIDALTESKLDRRPEIRVRTHYSEDRVFVKISDNGPGISRELREKLFDAHITTKPIQKGTGFGLSICRRIVRAFKGDVELESPETGPGATFTVWLPRENNGA